MFDAHFTHKSSTDLDSSIPDETIISLLHDFDAVINTNPNCRGYEISNAKPEEFDASAEATVYECKDALTFIPEKLWDGGVRYKAIYTKVPDGCDIIVKAPAGFSSMNKWRLNVDESGKKTMSIDSDNKCPRPFAPFVQSFLPKSHQTQYGTFKEKLNQRVADNKQRPS